MVRVVADTWLCLWHRLVLYHLGGSYGKKILKIYLQLIRWYQHMAGNFALMMRLCSGCHCGFAQLKQIIIDSIFTKITELILSLVDKKMQSQTCYALQNKYYIFHRLQ